MKFLKISGFTILFFLLVAGVLFYTQVYDYARYPLKADRARFPNVNTEAEVEALAEELLRQMTLDEKIEQLYGELPAEELAWYNADEREWQVETMPYEVFVGGSSADRDLLGDKFVVR